jgi:hypothetical protein
MVSDPARLLGWKRGLLELLDWSTCGHGLCEIKIQRVRYDRVVLIVFFFFFLEKMRDAYDYIASRLSGLHSRIMACSTRSLSAVKLTHGELAIYVRLAYWVAFGKDGVSLLWISRTVRTLNMECVLNSESQ